jgi:hypothetical protein
VGRCDESSLAAALPAEKPTLGHNPLVTAIIRHAGAGGRDLRHPEPTTLTAPALGNFAANRLDCPTLPKDAL